MAIKINRPAFQIVPLNATHWMQVSASEVAPVTLPAACTAYAAMLTAAPDVVIPAMNAKEVRRCIEASRLLAEQDETLSWAQHLVLVVQQAMAHSMGAVVSESRANAPCMAIVL